MLQKHQARTTILPDLVANYFESTYWNLCHLDFCLTNVMQRDNIMRAHRGGRRCHRDAQSPPPPQLLGPCPGQRARATHLSLHSVLLFLYFLFCDRCCDWCCTCFVLLTASERISRVGGRSDRRGFPGVRGLRPVFSRSFFCCFSLLGASIDLILSL